MQAHDRGIKMKIGDLAKHSGVSVHTLRYYEKTGLLKASQRTEANYRIYKDDDLSTVMFIQRCKSSGFSLQETAALISIKDNKSRHVCAEAKAITSNKINQLKKHIIQLQQMEETLIKLEQYCCGGQESAEFCSIISALEAEK